MTALSDALQNLFEFLVRRGNTPPSRDVRLFEIDADAKVDERGRPLLNPGSLRSPGEYDARFEQLMNSGVPWINVSCFGIAAGKLLVGIEVPRLTTQRSERTSINYSGPTVSVIENGWQTDSVLAIT